MKALGLILLIVLGTLTFKSSGMTLYEYYTEYTLGVPFEGLVAEGETFTLNGRDLDIYSGAMHYFRIHPQYWRDTLKKLRAAGLYAVETYMPWNLHNPEKDIFDFGDGGRDMSDFLDVRAFIQMAQQEDLFVILRPGPYICAEWEFGGLPYWLLKDPTNRPRTMYAGYTTAVQAYYAALLQQVQDLTYMQGGPIIMIQIENEYGHFGYDDEPRDKPYLQFIQDQMSAGFPEDTFYFTSDTAMDTFDWGALPEVFQTTNFQDDVNNHLDALALIQPNRPLMVMEFWTGWFDHWLADVHSTVDAEVFASNLELILQRNASVNFYMFIGGTSFGFMAGANRVSNTPAEYTPDITSYDYDAPLSEPGDYTEKYQKVVDLIKQYNGLSSIIDNPTPPGERVKTAFGTFPIEESLPFEDLISQSGDKIENAIVPVSMEDLGLDYGYVVYTFYVNLYSGSHTLLIRGHVRDMAQVLVNGKVITEPFKNLLDLNNFGFWNGRDKSIDFTTTDTGSGTITIMVENLGRVNYGKPHWFQQKKGLWEGDVMLDGEKLKQNLHVTLMGFKKSFVNSLTSWSDFNGSLSTPSAYRATVSIPNPSDTFLDMSAWNKGVVFVNGFNLGRYWSEGPQRTLYIPAPLLAFGDNKFVVFEQYDAPTPANLTFIDHPRLSRND